MNLEKIKAYTTKVGKCIWKYRSALFGAATSLAVHFIPLPSSIDDEVKGYIRKSISSVVSASFIALTCEGKLTNRNKLNLAISVGSAVVLAGMLVLGAPVNVIGTVMSAISIGLAMYRLHSFLATFKLTPA